MSRSAKVVVELSDHAVERWHERVRPGLSPEQAEAELVRQLEAYGRFGDQPDWHYGDDFPRARWLRLGEDIAFPVEGNMVVTCLTRAGYSPAARRLATQANKFDRRVRRAKEAPDKRRWQGKQAKTSRRRDKRWKDEAA